jgi:hypothetical protein
MALRRSRSASSLVARFLVVAGVALSASPRVARADAANQARADQLFTEANQLVDGGNYAAACPKYEESNRLDTGIGTEFKLADCYEHVDRPATALALFRLVERTAAAAGRAERQKAAGERAQALEGTVPRIELTTTDALKVDEYIIKCDGNVLGAADVATKIPLDAGKHVLSFSAPGRVSQSLSFTLVAHEAKAFPIPELALPTAISTEPTSSGRTQKTIAVVAGGVGLAGLLIGTVAGILSAHEHSVYTGCHCAGAVGDSQTAYTEGTVSTVGFIGGGVGVAAGLALWFTSPKGNAASKTGIELSPRVGPSSSGFQVRW